jgi:hypothetical protein
VDEVVVEAHPTALPPAEEPVMDRFLFLPLISQKKNENVQ